MQADTGQNYKANHVTEMISVNEALQRVRSNTHMLPPVSMPLQDALGHVVAADIYAGISIPNFNQSAMDGYSFRFADLENTSEFTILGEMAAGDNPNVALQPGCAVRIFTGAAVPKGYDTVVMQEKTEVNGNKVTIKDNMLAAGTNVRAAGSEIKRGDLALTKGLVLTPAAIGFLAGLGITDVVVYPKPVVHIIVTGKELQKPGAHLELGHVYESNSVMLHAALTQLNINNITISFAGDDAAEIAGKLKIALKEANLILLTGGVSVGVYDFVVQAAEACGVKQLFHRVAQRPGKPLYAGLKEGRIVFGLPGNPASVLSCFYNYVVAAIEEFTGRKALLERKQLPLIAGFSKKIPLRQFLKGTYTSEGALPLPAQESFRLSSFSVANCLIDLPEEKKEYVKGDMVDVLLLP